MTLIVPMAEDRDDNFICQGCGKNLGAKWARYPTEPHKLEECFEVLRDRIRRIEETLKSHNLG